MDIFGAMDIGYSALRAQSLRLNVIGSNLANMETTRTPEGGAYRKKSVIFTSEQNSFARELENSTQQQARGVRVERIITDQGEGKMVYEPSHPDANDEGYVEKPDISLVEQMTDMMKARGSYEANVTSIKAAQRMAMKALEIGR
ncbi:flagellar basal-body rod protein FlgC [Desulfosalsimonas propionicica]|uniref:Flagellar basal-body rod protein FlgC n=1 Tax=Desulfosalsimonas propionicica TaxID=332175 RepID=A0A7W0C8U5_9BACT|nr:flagellar basal body rod protein FlgC [Desulfosalsimonas propionicica]MBA2881295.1 flagellar basal-body rod protein FlgC [Desulfosalsimonas propionicica]